MTTKEFNDTRCEKWKKRLTDDESRIFLIVGMKQGGGHTFVADEALSPLKIAEILEGFAASIRRQNPNPW